MYNDKCTVLEWYDDWMVRSANWETKVPAVIMLKDYVRSKSMVRFSKSNVYLRDMYKCQYCNTPVTRSAATMDHVQPVSKGGKTNFENIVTACGPCNTRKGNKLLMKPMYPPYRPGYWELVRKRKQLPLTVKHPSWNQWLDLEPV